MITIVTGAAGFIGSHLCRRLLQYNDSVVIGIDDLSVTEDTNNINDLTKGYPDRFHFIFADVVNRRYIETQLDFIRPGIIEDVNVIFHAAARGELYFCREHPAEAVNINVNGTLSMLDILAQSKLRSHRHFVFFDTSAEYDSLPKMKGNTVPYYPTGELMSKSFPPSGVYSITKAFASRFVEVFAKKYGYGATLVRPFNVYGPSLNLTRDIPPVIGAFASNILQRKPCTIYGDGTKSRDFIYISDMIDMLISILDHRLECTDVETYNAGTGVDYSVMYVYRAVADYIKDNYGITPVGITFFPDQEGEAWRTCASTAKAESELGFKAKVTLEQGIAKTVQSMESLIDNSISTA